MIPPTVVESFIPEHSWLYFAQKLLLGEMLDV
jgi:hypothetical protein